MKGLQSVQQSIGVLRQGLSSSEFLGSARVMFPLAHCTVLLLLEAFGSMYLAPNGAWIPQIDTPSPKGCWLLTPCPLWDPQNGSPK